MFETMILDGYVFRRKERKDNRKPLFRSKKEEREIIKDSERGKRGMFIYRVPKSIVYTKIVIFYTKRIY